MENDAVICPRCGEFIGNTKGLATCPLCGCNLIGHSSEDRDDDTEN